jgi:imidazolonepropionase-like amidohydrolase
MRVRVSLLISIAVGTLSACTQAPDVVSGNLAITHARLLPMTDDRAWLDHTVVISGRRIVAIGPSSELLLDEAVPVIDAQGRTLMPSFVDTHVHLCDSNDLSTFLAYGVGAVRNMEGTPSLLHLRDAVAVGEIAGPLIRTTGPYTNAPTIADPDAAITTVEAQWALGYDAIKIHGPMSIETLSALGRTAAQHQMSVIGHVPRDQDLSAVLATGVMSEISHAEEYLYTLFANRIGAVRDVIIAEAVAASLDAGVRVTATLTTYDGIRQQAADVDSAFAQIPTHHLSPFSVRAFRPSGNRYARQFTPEDAVFLGEYLEIQRALINALSDAGVTLLTGTDANSPVNVPGDSLHREIEQLVRAGLSEFDALAAASRNGWSALSGDEWDGTVTIGAPAELVLLAADPLSNIAATRGVDGLVRAGNWTRRSELMAQVAAVMALRAGEQAFVDRLWDNTLEDALPWLEAQRVLGAAPQLSASILRCQAQRAMWDGVPEVALQALELIDQPSAIDHAYRGEVLAAMGRDTDATDAWLTALELAPALQQPARRIVSLSEAPP